MSLTTSQLSALLVGLREATIATIATAEAHVHQIDALLSLVQQPDPRKCPKCGSERLIAADDGFVCDVCTHSFTPPKETTNP